MKARIKGTDDPFKDVHHISIGKGGAFQYLRIEDVEFEQQQEPNTLDHWQEVRKRVAMMALPSIIPMQRGQYAMCDAYKKYNDCAEEAIRYADALVEKLKGVSTYQDNQ